MNERYEVLFTGFEPFLDVVHNPSFDVAVAAAQAYGEGAKALELPVTFSAARAFAGQPASVELLVCLGVSRRRRAEVEWGASNMAGKRADNDGVHGAGPLWPNEPERRDSATAAAFLQALGDDVGRSEDAGAYVCNALYYETLRAHEAGGPPTVFIHVPRWERHEATEFGVRLAHATRIVRDALVPDLRVRNR